MTGVPARVQILELQRKVVAKNDEIARELRERFRSRGLLVLNLLAGPGAGKTTLLEKTLQALGNDLRILVIEGDLKTARDAERIARAGGTAIQIVTNGTCHLESRMIVQALEGRDLEALDAIVIENVGNLVCPSSFDLGEGMRVVMASVPEGEDKPEKYPFMFEKADIIVLNKMDLMPHTDFNRDAFWQSVDRINRTARRIEISCRTGDGLDAWLGGVREMVGEARRSAGR